jgi:hypothetical protein
MKGGGGEWEGGYEGAEAFERGTFGFWGEEALFGYGETVVETFGEIFFSGFEFGGLLQGSIGCWEFWARGPGILTESWS